jgi:hypothetical protein
MAPQCPKHPGKEMIRVGQGTEIRGSGWDTYRAYYEDFLCPDCQFRLRQYFKVLDVGR